MPGNADGKLEHGNFVKYIRVVRKLQFLDNLRIKMYFCRAKVHFSPKKCKTCEITNLEPKVRIVEQVRCQLTSIPDSNIVQNNSYHEDMNVYPQFFHKSRMIP